MIEKIIGSSNVVKKILHHLMNIMIISIIYLGSYLFYYSMLLYYYVFIHFRYFTSILNYFDLSSNDLQLFNIFVEIITNHIMIIINLCDHLLPIMLITFVNLSYLAMICNLIITLLNLILLSFIHLILNYLIFYIMN